MTGKHALGFTEGPRAPTAGAPPKRRRRTLVAAWAIIWPLISFAAVGAGNEAIQRYIPNVLNQAETVVGTGPLTVQSVWPGSECDSDWILSFSQNSATPLPGTFVQGTAKSHVPLDTAMIGAGDAVYETGLLNLTMTATGSDPVVINSIDVHVFRRSRPHRAWAMQMPGECGGGPIDLREYSLDLDNPQPGVRLRTQTAGRPLQAFRAFEASKADPTQVHIFPLTCRAEVRWGVTVHYSLNGHSFETNVGTRSKPFVSSGGQAERYYRTYYGSDGVSLRVKPAKRADLEKLCQAHK